MNEQYDWMNYETWSESSVGFPKITKIHLQNFQAIAGPIDINLGDITFLVGPNSVGKSAVHDAIKFFQHVLEEGYGEKCKPETMARRGNRSERLAPRTASAG